MDGDVDVFVSRQGPVLSWTLDSVGGWPAELGWWTYLGPGNRAPAPPLPEVADRARRLPDGSWLVALLDDPAAVDPARYEELHRRWAAGA
ncbi:hypothetical protein [Actinoplanes sp. N902-109]|uniref:hypothetical protein n=1 Tax=Actinoplanes sp. (strain N902-109) TaxID=649831 RepID=UPI00032961B2|nr:hypothetical protein [Actinoplanes sp. N902-109]AGL17409.1 hypothetical protein L083_3899 [Actinoplanes sp. N902-109]